MGSAFRAIGQSPTRNALVSEIRRDCQGLPGQGAEGEDMVGIAAAIGVVAAGRNLALVVEQPIEHVRGFAGGRRDHLGVERRVSVGEVRIELDLAVNSIKSSRGSMRTAVPMGGPQPHRVHEAS